MTKALLSSAQLGDRLSMIVDGDRGAMRELYVATSAKLFGIVVRILTDTSESEDVLQDVYVAVWQSAGQYNSGLGRPMSWLSTMARNRAIDHLRRRQWVEPDGGQAAIWLVDPTPCAFTQLEQKQQSIHLQDCIGRLDARAAAVFRMAFYDGVTYVEVARRLGMTEGTAKSIIRRKLVELRDQVLQ